jgi:hypothetical protein
VKRLIARLHVILGAYVVGPRFYGIAFPRWGVGVMIYDKPE